MTYIQKVNSQGQTYWINNEPPTIADLTDYNTIAELDAKLALEENIVDNDIKLSLKQNLSDLITTVRGSATAEDTKYVSEKAVRTLFNSMDIKGEYKGSSNTFATLPNGNNGDWSILNTEDAPNKKGIYVSDGTTYSLAIEMGAFTTLTLAQVEDKTDVTVGLVSGELLEKAHRKNEVNHRFFDTFTLANAEQIKPNEIFIIGKESIGNYAGSWINTSNAEVTFRMGTAGIEEYAFPQDTIKYMIVDKLIPIPFNTKDLTGTVALVDNLTGIVYKNGTGYTSHQDQNRFEDGMTVYVISTKDEYIYDKASSLFIKKINNISDGLRVGIVADKTELKALVAKEYQIAGINSADYTKGDYVFKLTANLTPDELANGNNYDDNAGTGKWVKQFVFKKAAKRVGEFIHMPTVKFVNDADAISQGYFAIKPNHTITIGALINPKWASMFPQYVVGNDIVLPSDVSGITLRNLGGGAAAEGVYQPDSIKSHNHDFNSWNSYNGGPTYQGIETVNAGSFQPPHTTSGDPNVGVQPTGGAENRVKNIAYQLYSILDNYFEELVVVAPADLTIDKTGLIDGNVLRYDAANDKMVRDDAAISITVDVTMANGFTYLVDEQKPTITKVGNVVTIRGIFRNNTAFSGIKEIGTIPTSYRPDKNVYLSVNGNGLPKYGTVATDGTILVSNHTNYTILSGSWLIVN